jgi:hypothetical protein
MALSSDHIKGERRLFWPDRLGFCLVGVVGA